jgi:predicted dehydrogenase
MWRWHTGRVTVTGILEPAASTTDPVRVAVVGTGSLGKEHARIYAELATSGLVRLCGVMDLRPELAGEVASRWGVPVLASIGEVIEAAEAVSVVTPTVTHFDLARELLTAGCHVLVEKPMTQEGGQAAQLVELAQAQARVLQVGHVERFNPVFKYLQSVATDPQFIEVHRLSPYPARSTDVGVVLDLMIHDLDIVLAFVQSSVVSVEGVGLPVLSRSEDIANARVRFGNGCVANLTASRVSAERMRKIRVFSRGATASYVSLDYRAQAGYIYRLADDDAPQSSLLKKLLFAKDSAIVSQFGGRKIVREPVPIRKEEPLRLELQHFIETVRARSVPLVSGASAKAALDLALEITRQIEERTRQG